FFTSGKRVYAFRPILVLFRRGVGDDDPGLVPRDRAGLLDGDLVADLAGIALVMRLVLLRHADGLLHHRMREAALDADHDGLVILVAHDRTLKDALGHDYILNPCCPRPFGRRSS